MSKNFELLQKLGKEQDFLSPVPVDTKAREAAADSATMPSAPSMPLAANPKVNPGLEEIGALVQQLFLLPGASAPRSVALTSTEPGAGCTWVTARIGEVLAGRIAGSVCLVDANLKDPGLHQQFGLDNRNGLRDALSQMDPIRSFARPLGLPNLFLIPAGAVDSSDQTPLASDRMRLRITELRSEFDIVLIDLPALNVSSDVIGMSALCEGVLLVLKA